MTVSRLSVVLACGLAFAAASPALARYEFSTITAPGTPLGDVGLALAINDEGQVLVESQNTSAYAVTDIATLYNRYSHTYTPMPQDPAGLAGSTVYTGLNGKGQYVGFYVVPGGSNNWRGFEYSNGEFADIDPGATGFSLAEAINNKGQVVGAFVPDSTLGFVTEGLDFRSIAGAPTPANLSGALGINDPGTIVGNFGTAAAGRLDTGFIDIKGVITPISLPGFASTQVNAINNKGFVVGGASNDDYLTGEGFVWKNGVFTLVKVPGAVETFVYGINNKGDLVGEYTTADGSVQAWIGLYVPEPSTWATMLLGLGLAGAALRARRRRAVI